MRRILTAAQMKSWDAYTIERLGIPSAVLMERASLAAADEICRILDGNGTRPRVLVAAGSGNNGGDGFACARILFLRGIEVELYAVGNPEHRTEETRRQSDICARLHIPVYEALPDLSKYDLLVDAIFGIGLARDVTGRYAELIEAMNASGKAIVAIDIPSGIHADTGAVCGCAVRACCTVTMQAEKPGQLLYPGAGYTGKLIRADIGIVPADRQIADDTFNQFFAVQWESGDAASDQSPAAQRESGDDSSDQSPAAQRATGDGPLIFALEQTDLKRLLPARDPSGNKGTFGKVFLAAGSPGMAGAAYLSALASLRSGAGMVRILTPEENRPVLQQLLPEAVLAVYRTEEEALQKTEEGLAWCTAAAVGPGLGTGQTARAVVRRILADDRGLPLVIDADGLNILAGGTTVAGRQSTASQEAEALAERTSAALLAAYSGDVFITPHIVEMSRLSGIDPAAIKADLIGAAASFAKEANAVCILKDARSVIACPGGAIFINTSGNDGMATAGSGDVLTGICASLLAQGADREAAGALAAYIHGLAGDAAAKKHGRAFMKASDIVSGLSAVMHPA